MRLTYNVLTPLPPEKDVTGGYMLCICICVHYIILIDCPNMKLQDLHPIDSTILGLDNVYHKIGEHSYYINSERIQTPKKIITKSKQYLLASTSPQGFDAIVQ
jgi:hypothetical protein